MACKPDHEDADAPTRIPLAAIDRGDERFRISTRRDSGDLQPSICRIGLLIPPLVKPAEAGFIIVSGFRRVSACVDLGWDCVPVRLARPDASAYECGLRAVAENSLTRPLNLIEASRALHLLERNAPGGRVPPEDAAVLGLPSHAEMTSRLKRLCRLPTSIQDAIVDGAVSFAMACELGSMEAGLGSAFARLFLRLKPSLNKQREIVSLVAEIAGREGRDPQRVLEEACPPQGVGMGDEDTNRQIRDLRRRLRERRFPALAAAEKNFLDLRQRLKLGEAVQLAPPRDFEGTHFALTAYLHAMEDVVRLRDQLGRLIDHPDFKTLLTGKAGGFDAGGGA
jgi:ParB family chromosome partitioning protein